MIRFSAVAGRHRFRNIFLATLRAQVQSVTTVLNLLTGIVIPVVSG
jgi:hypothetical protein